MRLSPVFVSRLGERDPPVAPTAELEALLAALLEAGRAAWPGLSVPDDVFVGHIAERVPADVDPVIALRELHAADLFLACACSAGDPRALEEFDRRFIATLPTRLLAVGTSGDLAEEAKQRLRERLLVAQGDEPPRIAAYAGRGSLKRWFQVTAARVALNMRRGSRPETTFDEEDAPAIAATPADAEIAYLKNRYGAAFRSAFKAALVGLTSRQANVLRLHFLDGLSAESVGAIYKVSSRTVQRWIADLRAKILEATHREIHDRLELSSSQLDTLIRLFQSEMAAGLDALPRRPKP